MEHTKGTAVEDAAVRTVSVERTRQPPESANTAFERRFGSPERNPFLGWNPAPHSIRNYQMIDVVLDGGFRGLFNAQGFIRGTGYLVTDDYMTSLGVHQTHLVDAQDDSTVIIGCNGAHTNYFHWITQALPAIDFALSRAGQDRRVSLALPVLNAWQEESLDLLGYAGVRRVVIDDDANRFAFARAEYSEILNGGAAFSLSETTYRTYSRLRTAIEPAPQRGRKIYVARTDAPSRRMRNENAVIAEAEKRGFEIVVPGALTLIEQIRLFRSADVVVGTHGAGLTNIVFCESGTIIYELVPAHYTNACFCNLAYICRLRYWADAFESEGDGLPNLREWGSDTAMVTERMDEIGAVHAALQGDARQQTISAMDFLRGKPGVVLDPRSTEQRPAAPVSSGLLGRLRLFLPGRSKN